LIGIRPSVEVVFPASGYVLELCSLYLCVGVVHLESLPTDTYFHVALWRTRNYERNQSCWSNRTTNWWITAM